jgi:UPF0716 protein FxsA
LGRLLFLLFAVVPLIEIACFILIGNAIGLWPTLLGVLVMAVAGSLLLRYQGLSILNEMRSTMGRGELPARSLADAMMIGLAGVLLITPGYFTDLIGILLLIPPVRTAIYAYLRSRVRVVATATSASYSFGPRRVEDDTIELDSDEWRPR